MEVHDPRRASVTRRTFGHSGIAVHTWYACPALIKSIWAMAISQHQFYLDRKQSKSKIHAARSLSEIAIDLTETGTLKTSKLANMGSKGKIISGSSGSLLSSGSQESDSSQSAKKDMLAALKSRQEALEETLRQRLEELKKLCLREAELTGKLPVEYPLDPGEEPPIVRRRIGTAFKLDEQKILPKGEEAELERLEREFAIQSQITEAARRLASDPNVSKKLKKQRKTSYLNALKKLQEIENAINENRIKSGKKPTQRASLIIDDGNIASEDSSLSDALVLEDEDSQVTSTISPLHSPHKGLPPRPPSHNRPPPPQSLEGLRQMHCHRSDYDRSPIKPKMWSESSLDEPYEKVKKRSSHSHSSSHKRFPSTGSCAEAGGGSNSLQNSPIRGLPHWNSQSSMPSTPDLRVRSPHYVHSTRSVDISPTRLHSLALHFRHRSSSLESQGKLLGSENDTGSPDFYTPRTRSSNGSDPMDDCSSCTSHSSSEHYYPAQMNANYSTLAEDSPSKARQRQRQRQRAAGALGSASSGSMPNLAARGGAGGAGGAGGGVYLQPEPAQLAVPHQGVPAVHRGRRHARGGAQPGERPGGPLQRQGSVQDLQLLHGGRPVQGELARRRRRRRGRHGPPDAVAIADPADSVAGPRGCPRQGRGPCCRLRRAAPVVPAFHRLAQGAQPPVAHQLHLLRQRLAVQHLLPEHLRGAQQGHQDAPDVQGHVSCLTSKPEKLDTVK